MKVKLVISAIILGVFCTCEAVQAKKGGGEKVIDAPDDAGKKPATEGRVAFVSMDFDGNGRVNITDVQGMIDWLYLGGTPAS